MQWFVENHLAYLIAISHILLILTIRIKYMFLCTTIFHKSISLRPSKNKKLINTSKNMCKEFLFFGIERILRDPWYSRETEIKNKKWTTAILSAW